MERTSVKINITLITAKPCHDTSMRVPLIIRAPHGLEDTRVVKGPVSLADVYPTVLDLLDFKVPGGSWARVLEAQKYY
jgi:arylsulfatase A-like enzyme